MDHEDTAKIRQFYHTLELRAEEAVTWSRESLHRDRQSEKLSTRCYR